ncbi:MAG: ABC transporter permease [Deltaproteobacteria bacterium]|nr:ABC transporter permease [Deltaproteobacteria bacterium]
MKRKKIFKTQLGIAATFCLAAILMIYVSYALPRFLPGDFVTAMYAGSEVTLSPEQEADLRNYFNENQGFGEYLFKLLRLDWGYSYAFFTPVSVLFFEALPWTLLLLGSAYLLSFGIGFILGVETAWRRKGPWEKGLVGGMMVLEGIPEMITGVVLLLVFAFHLGWFPAAGADTAYAEIYFWEWILDVGHHLTLPLVTLLIAYIPGNFLLARNSMSMVIKAPFIITARAKGLPPRRIRYAHAARNVLLPLMTRFGLRFAFMVTGALIVERIYAYPGVGTLLFNAIQVRDLPVIQWVVLVSSLMVLLIILSLEWVYRFIDPRIGQAG